MSGWRCHAGVMGGTVRNEEKMGVPKKKKKSFWDYPLFYLYDDLLTFLSLIVLATIKNNSLVIVL
jgi:hypothetical protein